MRRDDGLAQRFEEHRAHLRAVAYRMLGSLSEADDAVQEAWLRLSRSDATAIGGRLRLVLRFTIAQGRIAEIDVVGDPERLRALDLAVLGD